MTTPPTDLAAAVARGSRLLDERRPGWWQDIRPARLVMSLPCQCVLGQLFDHFVKGLIHLWPGTDDEAEQYGFVARQEDYHRLDRLWLAEIARRREGQP